MTVQSVDHNPSPRYKTRTRRQLNPEPFPFDRVCLRDFPLCRVGFLRIDEENLDYHARFERVVLLLRCGGMFIAVVAYDAV